jgi:hypothetical protein
MVSGKHCDVAMELMTRNDVDYDLPFSFLCIMFLKSYFDDGMDFSSIMVATDDDAFGSGGTDDDEEEMFGKRKEL